MGTVGEGLCTEQNLLKILNGNIEADWYMKDILIQRLRQSPDKMELILSQKDYDAIRMMDLFEECVLKNKKKKAEYILNELMLKQDSDYEQKNAKMMHYYRMNAFMVYYCDRDIAASKQWLVKALDLTLPGWNKKRLSDYVISTLEMENLLAYAKLLIEQDSFKEADKLLDNCSNYIKSEFKDEEEFAKIYPKCVWLKSYLFKKKSDKTEFPIIKEQYLQSKEAADLFRLCDEAFNCLRKCGISYFMLPLLEMLVMFCGNKKLAYEKEKYRKWYEVLERAYAMYGEKWYPKDVLFHNCYQKSYHLDYELIAAEEAVQGYKNDTFAEGIYKDPVTYRRFKNKHTKPQNRKFKLMLEKLGIDKKRCNTYIAADSYEIQRLKREIDALVNKDKCDEVEERLSVLMNRIDLNIFENYRYVKFIQNFIAYRENRRNTNDILKEDLELLEHTYKYSKGGIYRVPFAMEADLLNQIALMLRKAGRKEEAGKIYDDLIKVMESSRISTRYRYRAYGLLLGNRASDFAASEMAEKSIRYTLRCGKLSGLGYDYMTVACAYLSSSSHRKLSKQFMNDAYYMCELAMHYIDREICRKYYEEKFGEKIV